MSDSLITSFLAVDGMSDVERRISGATGALSHAITDVLKQVQSLNKDMGDTANVIGMADPEVRIVADGFKAFFDILAAGVGVVGSIDAALADFLEHSFSKFERMQTMELGLEGFLGDAQKAKQMMDYLTFFSANGTPFQLMDLTNSARELTELGLDVNKYLPLVNKMSEGAFPEIKAGNLEEVMEIFRRIQGGEAGLALGPRGLGRFGIGENVLSQYGPGLFKKDGEDGHMQFTGTTEQALEIAARVIEDRFTAAADKIAKGSEVSISDLKDAIDRLEIQAGGELENFIAPIVKDLTDIANVFEQSDVMGSFVDELKSVLGLDDLKISEDGLTEALLSTGEAIIDLNYLLGVLIQAAMNVGGSLAKSAEAAINAEFPGMGTVLDGLVHGAYDSVAGDMPGHDWREAAENMMRMHKEHPDKKGAPKAPTPDKTYDWAPVQAGYLAQISRNTEDLARDFKRYALGGGDLMRMGASPMEIGGHSVRGGSHAAQQVMLGINQMVNEQATRLLGEMMRNGSLR